MVDTNTTIFDGLLFDENPYDGLLVNHLTDKSLSRTVVSRHFFGQFKNFLVDQAPKIIIDVYSNNGTSAVAWASLTKSLGLQPTIICVDIWQDPVKRGSASLKFLAHVKKKGFSKQIIPFAKSQPEAVDFFLCSKITADIIYVNIPQITLDEEQLFLEINSYFVVLNEGGLLCGQKSDLLCRVAKKIAKNFDLKIDINKTFWSIKKLSQNVLTSTTSNKLQIVSDAAQENQEHQYLYSKVENTEKNEQELHWQKEQIVNFLKRPLLENLLPRMHTPKTLLLVEKNIFLSIQKVRPVLRLERSISYIQGSLRVAFNTSPADMYQYSQKKLQKKIYYRKIYAFLSLSPLMDAVWYTKENPDIAGASLDPIEHYILYGAYEGRNPHPLFDSAWYLKENPDVAEASYNPLWHYLTKGFLERRSPNPCFNNAWYLEKHPHVATQGVEPLQHFLSIGFYQGFNPHPLFDCRYYLDTYVEGKDNGCNPLEHYIYQGGKQRFSPHPLFDPDFYIHANPDAVCGKQNPLQHYLTIGWLQGKSPHPCFDLSWYLMQYPDVIQIGQEPLQYFLEKGFLQGHNPHPLFDSNWYLEKNIDVAKKSLNPLEHYLRMGAYEKRNPHPMFDSYWYLKQNPDVAAAKINPLAHYISQGTHEGRSPHSCFNNPLFDTAWYISQYQDAAESHLKALEHYLRFGTDKQYNPHPCFDSGWYAEKYLNNDRNINAFMHFLEVGIPCNYSPHWLFDTNWYLQQNPDLNGSHPLLHYLIQGAKEGFSPHPLFDIKWYLEQNKDILLDNINPLIHYLTIGRYIQKNPNAWFDATWYAKNNSDVVHDSIDSLKHYIMHGGREKRNPHRDFDINWYLQSNLDVAVAGVDPLVHYLQHGQQENREPYQYATYSQWIDNYDKLSKSDCAKIAQKIKKMAIKPTFSIIMPVYNIDKAYLQYAIDSVLSQLYPHWQLCIADDCSSKPHIKKMLLAYAKKDKRIQVTFREKNGYIAAASNTALQHATGDFIALMDHDDALSQHALYMMAETINAHQDAMILYSDEDKIDSKNRRHDPYFKPDWNLELLRGQNYVCHLTVYKHSLVQQLGGFKEGYNGAQDWDLILRATEAIDHKHIHHVPFILYHWRALEGSVCLDAYQKPYAYVSARKALTQHFERLNIKAYVKSNPAYPGFFINQYALPEHEPMVSLIIPTRAEGTLWARCLNTMLIQTSYKNYEIILVNNGHKKLDIGAFLSAKAEIRVVQDDQPFNWSAINNAAVKYAKGSILGFLNDDIEVRDGDWLGTLVSYAVMPHIGAVGAKLLYPNGFVQHAGIVVGIAGHAGHAFKHAGGQDPGYFGQAILARHVSAVQGACLLSRREVFESVQGFDESFSVAFNDVAFGLKLIEKGLSVVFTPHAQLIHHESATRGYEETPAKKIRFKKEREIFRKKWKNQLEDRMYNPNLTVDTEDFKLAFPPRVEKYWQ